MKAIFSLAAGALLLAGPAAATTTENAGSAVAVALPVLAVVPRMRSDAERRREFKRRVVMNLGFGATVMVCLAVLVYTYFLRP